MNLLLTLGHNASAILVDNSGNVINGVEEERVSRIKADSHFPRLAIEHVLQDLNDNSLDNIFISHWFDDFDFLTNAKDNKQYAKYYDNNYIMQLLNKYKTAKIITLSKGFTHHDAHASSVVAFYNNFSKEHKDCHIIVADGFGNQQEVFTIYKLSHDKDCNSQIERINRIYGYSSSLGLLYQYATAYCGMKENKDEWKYLAYESHILEEFDNDAISKMKQFATNLADMYCRKILTSKSTRATAGDFLNIDALNNTRTAIYKHLTELTKILLKIEDSSSYKARIAVGFTIQATIENILQRIISHYKIENLLVAGGIFYNVKLNNCCLKALSGNFCVIPLAGDQGAAIGLYYHHTGNFNFSNLCWSNRNLTIREQHNSRVESFINKHDLTKKAISLLKQDKLVQIVVGRGEFGPRALCHTSTLFLPQRYNAEINDAQNNRLSLMPLAPVMLARNTDYFFDESLYKRVVGSDRYMIITYDFLTKDLYSSYNGVMHKYPLLENYSGRPQVVDDENSTIYAILDELEKETGIKALVNTSFNIHSEPIVFSGDNALSNFQFQQKHCPDQHADKTYLLIGNYTE